MHNKTIKKELNVSEKSSRTICSEVCLNVTALNRSLHVVNYRVFQIWALFPWPNLSSGSSCHIKNVYCLVIQSSFLSR